MTLSDRLARARSTVGPDDSRTLTFIGARSGDYDHLCSDGRLADSGDPYHVGGCPPVWVRRAQAKRLPVRVSEQ